MRHETIDVRKKGVRRETIDASHVSRLASKTPLVSRLTSHVRSAPAAAWPKVKLGEVLRIKHGYAFDGSGITTEDNGVVLVTPGNFQIGGGFKDNNKKFFAQDYPTDYVLKRDDFIVTMTDLSKDTDTLGYSAKIPDSNKVYLHNQRIGLVDVFNPAADREYVYWFMRTRQYQRIIAGCASGVSVKHTSPTKIYGAEIPLPPLPVQRRIADILSAYDDLIENNRRRIAILEETARLAYRKWFGGEVGCTATLGEIAEVVMGQSPESKTYNPQGEGLPFHQGVTSFGFRYPSNEMWCTAGTRFAEEGDILFSVRAPVGRINVASERIVIGRGLSAMRARNKCQSWLLYTLKQYFSKEDMIGVGCIFASTTKKELLSVELPFPPEEDILAFERLASPIDSQIKVLSKQSAALAAARDKLLPRLMKGEVA